MLLLTKLLVTDLFPERRGARYAACRKQETGKVGKPGKWWENLEM